MDEVRTKLKTGEVEVPANDPFRNDKLDRKACAEVLESLIRNVKGPLVISINGGWGTGKTTFLKMCRQDLEDKGSQTMYFNAWQDDYCNDALVALIGQLSDGLAKSNAEEILQGVRECAMPLLKRTSFKAVEKLTGGILDLNDDDLQSIAKKTFGEYKSMGEKLRDLRRRLGVLAATLSQDGKPLAIFIDELDRCRPTFAIELLERVKHLFDTPGIVFVLGIDREQLGHSIKSVYGVGMDVDGYLRRFIDMEFMLPERISGEFCKHLLEQFNLRRFFQDRNTPKYPREHEYDNFVEGFTRLFALFGLSLRDQEYCIRTMAIAAASFKEEQRAIPYLLTCLIVLRLVNDGLYKEFISGRCSSEKIMEYFLEQTGGSVFYESLPCLIMEAHLLLASPKGWRTEAERIIAKRAEGQPVTGDGGDYARIVKMPKSRVAKLDEMCRWVREENFREDDLVSGLEYLCKKIELDMLYGTRFDR